MKAISQQPTVWKQPCQQCHGTNKINLMGRDYIHIQSLSKLMYLFLIILN